MNKKIPAVIIVILSITILITGCVNPHYIDRIMSQLKEKKCGLWYDSKKDEAYVYPYLGLKSDGTLRVLDFNHGLYESGNKGDSWTKLRASWVDELAAKNDTNEYPYYAKMNPLGEWIVLMSTENENDTTSKEDTINKNEGVIADNENDNEKNIDDMEEDYEYVPAPLNVYYVDTQGTVSKLSMEINEGASICDFDKNGRVVVLDSYTSVGRIYNVHNSKLSEFDFESGIDNVVVADNKLYELDYDGISVYNLDNGKKISYGSQVNKIISQIYETSNYDNIKFLSSGDKLYILCDNGMYSFNQSDGTIKLLFDGRGMMCSKEDWCLTAYAIDSTNFYFVYSGLADSLNSVKMIKVQK